MDITSSYFYYILFFLNFKYIKHLFILRKFFACIKLKILRNDTNGGVYIWNQCYVQVVKRTVLAFNILEQQVKPVKINPQTGQVEEEYTNETMNAFHMAYQGPTYRVQCAVCGLVENPEQFIKPAQNQSF